MALFDLAPYMAVNSGMKERVRTTSAVAARIAKKSQSIAWPENYHIVKEVADLGRIARLLTEHREFVFDVETTGLVPQSDRLLCCSLYVGGQSFVVPFEHAIMPTIGIDKFRSVLGEFFTRDDVKRINHNIKFDAHFIRNAARIPMTSYHCDTDLQSRVIDSEGDHGLKELGVAYGLDDFDTDETGKRLGGSYRSQFSNNAWSYIDPKVAAYYACKDAELGYKVYQHQCKLLKTDRRLDVLFWQLEMPVSLITFEMERLGIRMDEEYFETVLTPNMYAEYNDCVDALRPYLTPYLYANETIEKVLESPARLASIYFDEIKVPLKQHTTLLRDSKGEWKRRSLSKAALSAFSSEFKQVELLAEYRKVATVKKMFIDALPQRMLKGRVHPNIRVIGTATGRMSMDAPNLQQIPSRMGATVRNAFLPDKGHVFVSLDYSGQEMRILASISQDEKLLKFFREGSKLDIYSQAAYDMEDSPTFDREAFAKLPKDKRKKTKEYSIYKALILGLGYGMSAATFARNCKMPKEWGERMYAKYYATYPGVKRYQDRTIEYAGKTGYTVTVMGRRRKIPDIHAMEQGKRGAAERAAMNHPIQGTAADQTKRAAVAIHRLINEQKWPARIALFVHDEIVFSIDKKWLRKNPQHLEAIRQTMINALPLHVPVESSVEIEERWGTVVDLEKLEDAESIENG